MDDGRERLRKVLELERSKGFTNSIVTGGGLDAFLGRWAGGRRMDLPPLSSGGYAAMAASERSRWIEEALKRLAEASAKAGPTSPAAPTEKELLSPSRRKPLSSSVALDSPVTAIKGIQSSLAQKFEKLGISTIRDLIYFFPHRHNDFRNTVPIANLVPGAEQTVKGFVWEASIKRLGPRTQNTEVIIGDETGNVRAVWFNNPYLAKTLKPNQQVALSGKVGLFKGRPVFESPDYEVLSDQEQVHTGRLVPVYPLTEGLYQRAVRNLVRRTLIIWASRLVDYMPGEIKERGRFLALPKAVYQAHYPDDDISKDEARRRLAFDELFLMQLKVLARRREWQEGQEAHALKRSSGLMESFLKALPFSLTKAQSRALEQVLSDMEGARPMARLLQGDVGSGKTVVAAGALLQAAAHGYQGAIMVPTEILAEQHFQTLCRILGTRPDVSWGNDVIQIFDSFLDRPVRVGLLISDIRGKAKRELHGLIREGGVDLVVGTHALIQKEVEFHDLALAVVDEQHRFGVMQRSALRQKGLSPHLLVMTATPIPRTLALTLYGDLDLSVLGELPPGRLQIKTKWVQQRLRGSAYEFLRKQVKLGRQAFIICPLIEESEALQTRAAVEEHERLSREVFPDLRLGLLHGRLSPAKKDQVMEAFRDGALDILVSTPVVEVGIDVPNATVMMVEGADRFGLAQLHQFRGRVGRGPQQSYCLLMAETLSPEARERLTLMEKTTDGFLLAEEDLRLRGPGEFFGTRQSGLPDLRMARLSDSALLELARREAEGLLAQDPGLQAPEHRALAQELARLGPMGLVGGTEA